MGESAKLLNEKKTVLMPDPEADCPMAHMARPEEIRKIREREEDLAVVCYINSTAALKACADVCVTSANALDVVRALPNRKILMVPDQNLAHFVAQQVPEKEFLFHPGCCPVHQEIRLSEVLALKEAHPEVPVLAHPECPAELLSHADYVGSTSGIIRYAAEHEAQEYIICTEIGVRHRLERDNPGKRFYFPATSPVCRDMKRVTLEKVLEALRTGKNPVSLPREQSGAARRALEQMLRLAR